MSERPNSPAIPNIGKRGIGGFYRDVTREMRHVTWPSRSETTRLTGVVLGVCLLIAIMLTALSFGFDLFLRMIGIGGGTA